MTSNVETQIFIQAVELYEKDCFLCLGELNKWRVL